MIVDIVGWTGTLCLIIASWPQIIKVVQEGHANGLSLAYLLLIWFGLISMGAYVLFTTLSIQLLFSYGIQFLAFSFLIYRKLNPKEQMLH